MQVHLENKEVNDWWPASVSITNSWDANVRNADARYADVGSSNARYARAKLNDVGSPVSNSSADAWWVLSLYLIKIK